MKQLKQGGSLSEYEQTKQSLMRASTGRAVGRVGEQLLKRAVDILLRQCGMRYNLALRIRSFELGPLIHTCVPVPEQIQNLQIDKDNYL